jgi:hypothetical protein
MIRVRLPAPSLAHVAAMTDERGIFEHAQFKAPRLECGYCTDDVARALTVVVRDGGPETHTLTQTYLAFLERALTTDGSVHNRMSVAGSWTDTPTTGDCWGRAVGALGHAARYGGTHDVRTRAARGFLRAARTRSQDVRASCFAASGAIDMLRAEQSADGVAASLLADCLDLIPRRTGTAWEWPEPRLRYANAALCNALIAGGAALRRPTAIRQGLTMLTALVHIESSPHGHFSVTGTEGRAPGETGPLWDQQPIELSVLADACTHAYTVTGDTFWARKVGLAWSWFTGENDAATELYERDTGAGHDGLQPGGRNENCGAESTIAALNTLQRAREIAGARP